MLLALAVLIWGVSACPRWALNGARRYSRIHVNAIFLWQNAHILSQIPGGVHLAPIYTKLPLCSHVRSPRRLGRGLVMHFNCHFPGLHDLSSSDTFFALLSHTFQHIVLHTFSLIFRLYVSCVSLYVSEVQPGLTWAIKMHSCQTVELPLHFACLSFYQI